MTREAAAGAPSAAGAEQNQVWAAWKGLLENGKALLGLLALLIYGVVRVATDSFYERLAITAEQVGLSQAEILGRAALYFVASVLLFAAVGGLIALLMLVSAPKVAPSSEGGQGRLRARNAWVPVFWAPVTFLLVLPFIIWLLELGILRFIFASKERIWWASVAYGLLLLVAILLSRLALRIARQESDSSKMTPTTMVLIGASLAAVAVIALHFARTRGSDLGQHVMNGRAVRAPLLSVRADPVCLAWKAEVPTSFPRTGPFMYLGEAEGNVVLYDSFGDLGAPLFIPSGSAIIRIADPAADKNSPPQCLPVRG